MMAPWLSVCAAKWMAVAFACLAVSLAVQGVRVTRTPCRRLEVAARPTGDPLALPIAATPGAVRLLDDRAILENAFVQTIGPFELAFHHASPGDRWGDDDCVLRDTRSCDSERLTACHDEVRASDLVVRQTPGGVYVLTSATPNEPGPDFAFRSLPSGARSDWTGGGPVGLAFAAVTMGIAGLLVQWRTRRRMRDLAGWRDGVMDAGDNVLPANGDTPLLAGKDVDGHAHPMTPGTKVMFRPVAMSDPYRGLREPVETRTGTRSDLDAWHAARGRRAAALYGASIAVSVVVAALTLAR